MLDFRKAGGALAAAVAIAVVIGATAGEAHAQYVFLRCDMDGSQAVPPNGSTASGTGLFVMDRAGNTMTTYAVWAGEGGPDSAAHIHGYVPPGQTGGVRFVISAPGPNTTPYVNVWSYLPEDEDEILAGLSYVNVHTILVPTGEIRGQIYAQADPTGGLLAVLDGAQVVPPSGSVAGGHARFMIDTAANVLAYVVDVAGLEGAETAAALRGYAGPGGEGAVLHDLPLGDSKIGYWSYPEADESALLAGEAYLEVRTTAHPEGELRGQVIPLPSWVWVVDASGAGDFADLQAAVDEAREGDTLLVRSGLYSSFTVDGKSLCICADQGAQPSVQGSVSVANLQLGQALVLSGLAVDGQSDESSGVAFAAQNNVGSLRVQDCALRAATGADAAQLTACFDASFVQCAVEGGAGEDTDAPPCDGPTAGGTGGTGVTALQSAVALYACDVRGGAGGDGCASGGHGGLGYVAVGFGVFASGSAFTGGAGGSSSEPQSGSPGDGGDGLNVAPNAQAQLQDVQAQGGAGGSSPMGGTGSDGDGTVGGGVLHFLPGAAHDLQVPAPVREDGLLDLTVTGPPGDEVHLMISSGTRLEFVPSLTGALLVARPLRPAVLPVAAFPEPDAPAVAPTALALGKIPPSGVLSTALPIGQVLPGAKVERVFLQAVAADANGVVGLTGAVQLTLLDASL